MKLYEILAEKALAIKDLIKHLPNRARIDAFIQKLKNGDAFELEGGGSVVLKKDPTVIRNLEKEDPLFPRRFETVDGKIVALSNLKKTSDLGGESSRKRLEKEDFALGQLNNVIKSILDATGKKSINIKIGNVIVKNVTGAASTPGTPKSDFHLLSNGKEVGWISHKDSPNPRKNQQWGGVTEPAVMHHPEIKKFGEAIRKEIHSLGIDSFPPKQTWARKIKDQKLKMMSVFGNDFGGAFGRDNVNVLLQGKLDIKQVGNTYVLTADKVYPNGTLPSGPAEPVFMVRYMSDRKNLGVDDARVSIAPAGSRTVHKQL